MGKISTFAFCNFLLNNSVHSDSILVSTSTTSSSSVSLTTKDFLELISANAFSACLTSQPSGEPTDIHSSSLKFQHANKPHKEIIKKGKISVKKKEHFQTCFKKISNDYGLYRAE